MVDFVLPKGVFRLSPSAARGAPQDFPFGLGQTGIHEVCELAYGDRPAATGFALAHIPPRGGPVLVITEHRGRRDHGTLYGPGLQRMMPSHAPFLFVEANKGRDSLWATEEAMASGVPRLVITETQELDFTASRRLALITEKTGVPAILLLPYTASGSTAAAARWRVRSAPSSLNVHDPSAPGAIRWQATPERLRASPEYAGHNFEVEWNDETLSVDLVSRMAPHPAETVNETGNILQGRFG